MILEVKNGCFNYGGKTPVLSNINFAVSSGEMLAVLGPNGAGKTTLLRCVMGMLKWDSGESLLNGENMAAMSSKQLWTRLAYVPQSGSATGIYTVFETVLLGRSSRLNVFSAPGKEDIAKAEEAMEKLGISHLADKKCSQLSGGELQMVHIARALASEPEVLILDEPESNLDFKNQLIVLDTMSRLTQEGIACVFNTHYPTHALQRADKSLILSKDGAYVFGSTSEVVNEENIRKAFGVDAVIGEVETSENIIKDVLPVKLASAEARSDSSDARRIASLTIIFKENSASEKINAILHEYGELMIGRMGMPYRECGLYIINVTLDGKEKEINELSHRLSIIPDLSVKTTFAKGDF